MSMEQHDDDDDDDVIVTEANSNLITFDSMMEAKGK